MKLNNKSWYVWVHFDKNRKQWVAYIKYKYKRYHLWRYNTIEEAIEARKEWEKKYWWNIVIWEERMTNQGI